MLQCPSWASSQGRVVIVVDDNSRRNLRQKPYQVANFGEGIVIRILRSVRDSKIIKKPRERVVQGRYPRTTSPRGAGAGSELPPGPWLLPLVLRLSDRRLLPVPLRDGCPSTSWCGQTGALPQLSRVTPHSSGSPGCPSSVQWGCTCYGTVGSRPTV